MGRLWECLQIGFHNSSHLWLHAPWQLDFAFLPIKMQSLSLYHWSWAWSCDLLCPMGHWQMWCKWQLEKHSHFGASYSCCFWSTAVIIRNLGQPARCKQHMSQLPPSHQPIQVMWMRPSGTYPPATWPPANHSQESPEEVSKELPCWVHRLNSLPTKSWANKW